MRAPPSATAEKPPDEILTGSSRQLVEVPPGDVDRHDAARLATNRGNADVVAHVERDRLADPEHDDEPDDREVQRDPIRGGNDIVDEVAPYHDLVQEGEGNRQVRVE